MKFEKNDRYFNIGVYVFFTWLAILIASCVILRLSDTLLWIKWFIGLAYLLLEPLIIGLVIAYLLHPLVDFYEDKCQALSFSDLFHRQKMHRNKRKEKRWPMRTVPTLLAFLSLILILAFFILLIRMNIKQVAGDFSILTLRRSIGGYIDYFEEMLSGFSDMIRPLGIKSGPNNLLTLIYQKVNQYVLSFYSNFIENLSALSIHIMNWLLAFVIAFYLLQDSRRVWFVTKRLSRKILRQRYVHMHELLTRINGAVAGFIRGEVLDSIIITILTCAALTVIQLDFAIIIGIISGIFNLIPYFGPIVGFVLAIIIGLLDPNPMKAVYGGIAILIIQQIDGWFIVPKIVGNCVKLHPVIVLLAILIGGNLFGLIGMLLAVPIAAVIRILLIYYFPDYFEDDES